MTPPGSDPRFPVLSCQISATSIPAAAKTISDWLEDGGRHYVNVCTTHTTLECRKSPQLADIVNRASLAAPDGMPLVWVGRSLGHPTSRVYGPDLMLAVCEQGLPLGCRHFLYGATEEKLSALSKNLSSRFPGILIAGTHAPPFRELTSAEKTEVAQIINQADPHVVWVGLGTPKQDYWVGEFRPMLNAPVLIAVGAAIDFHSGHLRQAPRWMMRCGLEWLFRLLMEPRRLWRRYLLGNPTFMFLIARQLFFSRKPKPSATTDKD